MTLQDTGRPCKRPARGWSCGLWNGHLGPCPSWPRWWNLTGHLSTLRPFRRP